MRIVTGYRGEPHLVSDDLQAFNKGAIGDAILPIGQRLHAELTTSNNLRIYDGTAIMGGVEFRVEPGTYDDVAIDNGTQGMNRTDLVCARYQKDGSTGVESMSWAVLKGTPTSGTPQWPTVPTGDIIAGATDVYFPMFRVSLAGLTPSVEELCSVLTAAADNQATITSLPRAIQKSSMVVNGTSSDDVTLWTVPSGYNLEKVTVAVTNPYYAVNPALPIATYIDANRRVHAKLNVSRVSGFCRFNYIVWYWGD